MTTDQLIELHELKQEIKSKGYYIDITLHAGDEVLVQIGEPNTGVLAEVLGDDELLAIKLVWNMFCMENLKTVNTSHDLCSNKTHCNFEYTFRDNIKARGGFSGTRCNHLIKT